MSDKFSLASWVLNLGSIKSCIHSVRKKYRYYDDYDDEAGSVGRGFTAYSPHYYSLAEDGNGQHLPFNMLPGWAQSLFQLRLRISKERGHYIYVRGLNWWFHCPTPGCDGKSFYSYRGTRCWNCGWVFDKDLKPKNLITTRPYTLKVQPDYIDGPDDLPF